MSAGRVRRGFAAGSRTVASKFCLGRDAHRDRGRAGCVWWRSIVGRRQVAGAVVDTHVDPNANTAGGPVATGTPTVGANQFGVTVANYPALAAVGGIAVVRTSPAIALARTATGFVAFSLRCPHEGTTVNVLSNSTLRCPNHGATFASSGSWSGGYRTGSLSARGVTSSADKTFVVVNLS